jgi:hypothetical protein
MHSLLCVLNFTLLACRPYFAEVGRTTCNVGQAWFRLRKRKMNIPFKSTIIRSTAIIIWAFYPLTPPPPLFPAPSEGITQLVARDLVSSTGVTLKSMADCVVGGSRSREKLLFRFVLSVFSHVWASLRLDRFDIEDFYENLSRNSKFG